MGRIFSKDGRENVVVAKPHKKSKDNEYRGYGDDFFMISNETVATVNKSREVNHNSSSKHSHSTNNGVSHKKEIPIISNGVLPRKKSQSSANQVLEKESKFSTSCVSKKEPQFSINGVLKKEPQIINNGVSNKYISTDCHWCYGGDKVFVSGSFNNWTVKIPLVCNDGVFKTSISLLPGKHEYKYFVDGNWIHDKHKETTDDHFGGLNNVIYVS